jgi:Fic family protein
MPIYIHQRTDWPAWRWDHDALAPALSDIRHRQGRLLGWMELLGFALRQQAGLLRPGEAGGRSTCYVLAATD